MAGFAGQQINFPIFSFDANGQAVSDAHSRALGVIGTTQVVGDVASHIEHLARDENFLRARDRTVAALRPFFSSTSAVTLTEMRMAAAKLRNARPISRKRIGRLRTIFSDSPIGGSIPRSFARIAS